MAGNDASRARSPRQRRLAETTRELLAALFPMAFARRGEEKRPLKIGIGTDILLAAPELSGFAVALALQDYTWGATYVRNVVEGADRIGLDGKPFGKVTEQQAAHAAQRFAMFARAGAKARKADAETGEA